MTDLSEIRAALAAATPGPWEVQTCEEGGCCMWLSRVAPAWLAELCDRLDDAEAKTEAATRQYGAAAVRAEAAEAEAERLQGVEHQLEVEQLHANLGPDGVCDVCAHLEFEHLSEQWEAEMDRAEAAEAKLAAVRELVWNWQSNSGSRALGDPTAETWNECARQLLRALDGEQP